QIRSARAADRSASLEGAPSKREPVTAMKRPVPYTSIRAPSGRRILRPTGTSPRPKTCRPVPDGDTSTYVDGIRSKISRAHEATLPSSTQWSRSTHTIPSPFSTNPSPTPAFDRFALAYVVQVAGSVDDATRYEVCSGTFLAERRTQRARSRSALGAALRALWAATRQRVEQ